MGLIDYSLEPKSDIAFVDIKSFYASVECVNRNLHPLTSSLCVMSRADNSNGLILAASPTFKKVFGKNNVGRARDLPFNIDTRKFNYAKAKLEGMKFTDQYVNYIESWAKKTHIVPPRMALYIEENLKIQKIFQNYAPSEYIHPYSIDEGFLDLSGSLNYFIPEKSISRKDKLDSVSARIQKEILHKTGVYSTVGMSNANPLLAKLALDNEAKQTPSMRANWSYEDVETKVWSIKNLTDFWGIGKRIGKRLNKLSIYSIKQLANYDPDELKKEFGVIGVQLWFHANGIDESKPSIPYIPRDSGLGNSQILPRNYSKKSEIELVIREMAEQVAIRIRRISKKATAVGIYIGFSHSEKKKHINAQMAINPTCCTEILANYAVELFNRKYTGGTVRQIGVHFDKLIDESYSVYTLFNDMEKISAMERLDKTIDSIRKKYGFLSVQKGSSLLEGSRVIERSKLIGGHCGGMDGIQ